MRASLIMWVMGSNMCNFISCLQHCPFCQIYRKWRPNQLCSSPWPMVNDHVCQIFWVKPLVHASATLISPVVGISPSRSQGWLCLSPGTPTPASCQMPEKWAGWPSHGISIQRQPCHQMQLTPKPFSIRGPEKPQNCNQAWILNKSFLLLLRHPLWIVARYYHVFAVFGVIQLFPSFIIVLLLNSEHSNSNLGQIPGWLVSLLYCWLRCHPVSSRGWLLSKCRHCSGFQSASVGSARQTTMGDLGHPLSQLISACSNCFALLWAETDLILNPSIWHGTSGG